MSGRGLPVPPAAVAFRVRLGAGPRSWGSWLPRGALLTLGAALLALSLGGVSAQAKSGASSVVTFAEQPSQPPTYILPLESSAEESNANFAQFSNVFYPPLYVFDATGRPVLDEALSIGKLPQFSDGDQVVTLTLKHWNWSNGTPVTARDIVFWLNLLSAVTDPNAPPIGSGTAPGPGWGFFVPGEFPQNVVSYTATGPYTVVLHLNRAYNPTWFLYNELSQITPIPQVAWDKLSAGGAVGNVDTSAATRVAVPNTSPALYVPQDPGTASSGALGVAQFLNLQAQDLATYTTDPLWQVVDGAFRLSDYTSNGFVKMVPNPDYSGQPKPTISAFEELPFTSDSAEALTLRSGTLTMGYLPPTDLKAKAQFEKQGNYRFSPWNVYGIGYISYNFTNPKTGPVMSQLYFRQALQMLVNQPQYISKFLAGYGSVTNGPVPSSPATKYTSSLEKGKGPYPYDPSRAKSLLREHGWKVLAGGTSYCAHPGKGAHQCGAGVKRGERASLGLLYASGNTAGAGMVTTLQSEAKRSAGIAISLKELPFDDVIMTEFGGCTNTAPCSNWDMAALFVGWTFGPDYLPTGEEIFGTGAGSNAGYYSNPTNDANIAATQTASTSSAEVAAMHAYENYLARQLPAMWTPMTPLQLTLYKRNLKGVEPQGIIDQVFPQFYRLS